MCSKLIETFSVKEENAVKIKKTPFSSKIKPLYIINKNNNWHSQKQKTTRILLASDFVMWTVRYIQGLVFCFSYADYTDYKLQSNFTEIKLRTFVLL